MAKVSALISKYKQINRITWQYIFKFKCYLQIIVTLAKLQVVRHFNLVKLLFYTAYTLDYYKKRCKFQSGFCFRFV